MKESTNVGRICFAVIGGLALLAFLCFILWRIHLSRDVETQLQAIRAAGLPTSPAELNAWYANVPDDQNAAKEIEAAIALLRDYTDQRSKEVVHFKLSPHAKSLSTNELALLSGYVDLNREAIAKVRAAITLPASRYSADLSWGYDTKVPHLAGIKKLAQLEAYEALVAVSDGRTHDVVACIETQLGLARTLDGEPVLISQLVRVACLRIAADTVQRALPLTAWNRAALEEVATNFSTVDRTGFFVRAFIGERATAIPTFRMSIRYLSRIQADAQNGTVTDGPPDAGPQPLGNRVTGFFERDLNFYLQTMGTNIAYARLPPPQSLGIREFLENRKQVMQQRYYVLSAMLLPSLSRAVEKEPLGLAYVRATEAALAVELYRQTNGALPENLQAAGANFVDPFDGASLRYRKRPERGYIIYSVGPDGQDDQGKEPPATPTHLPSERYDLPFIVDR